MGGLGRDVGTGGWKFCRIELSSLLHVRSFLLCVHSRSVTKSCVTVCDPMCYSPPSSSVHGIFQARLLVWVSISYSRDIPDPGMEPTSLESSVSAGIFFTKQWHSLGRDSLV